MKNQFKKLIILALTGILIGTTPTISVSAASLKIEDADNKDNNKEEKTEEETDKKEVEIEEPKKEINYSTEIVTITKSKFVADSFNGVDALYRKGKNDGS